MTLPPRNYPRSDLEQDPPHPSAEPGPSPSSHVGGPALEAIGLSLVYGSGATTVHAVNEVDLAVHPGEMLALMGPSGSGKTTLLMLLGGLLRASSGTVRVEGHDIGTLSKVELSRLRLARMGFIFQTFNLLPVITAVENVELPLLVSGVRPGEARQRALTAIKVSGWRRVNLRWIKEKGLARHDGLECGLGWHASCQGHSP